MSTTTSVVPLSTRLERSRIMRHPENSAWTALMALQCGSALSRPMTIMERNALAIASTAPTQHLTLSDLGVTRTAARNNFRRLLRRVERRMNPYETPLIYFAVLAQGQGDGGYHMHLLLWKWPKITMWRNAADALGLGNPHVERIHPRESQNVFRTVTYVLGQEQSVFGSSKHLYNEHRDRYGRGFRKPHMKTLERRHPELFAALTLANDKCVSDETLFRRLPIFIKEYKRTKVSLGNLEVDLAEAA